MKCEITINNIIELVPAYGTDMYNFYIIDNASKHELLSISSESENTIVLFLSGDKIHYNSKGFSKYVIAPMGRNCTLDVTITSKSYIICYDLTEEIYQESCSGLYNFINPYDYIVAQLCSSLKGNDVITITALKHLALLSLTHKKTIPDFNRIEEFIFTHIRNTDLSLDLVAESLFMSRRKIQYILNKNNTTYGHLVDSIRFQIFSSEEVSGLSIQQILLLAGVRNISTANRIFLKKSGMTMREFLSNEDKKCLRIYR
ncbi:hypothetical protein C0W42_08945 [Photobacterium kishitanii]|uniref:AraC family transcriptional regulator n=1 Tax=Photobacterium kishitanii TaxID=318456 RepID=UPI000D15A36A|nr:AraC family transcriptional regulator [Photobacterium kishitanii]PSU89905.1 hypothetical protein C0W42_08945 [Photobacterium kishitanii]